MKRIKKFFKKIKYPLLFIIIISVINMASEILVWLMVHTAVRINLITEAYYRRIPLIFYTLLSFFTATVITAFTAFFIVKSFDKYINAFGKAAKGDYSVRIELKGTTKVFGRLTRRFNDFMTELSRVEMLSSDFVNNFSHEFRTPIVSIKGFAKMLKSEDLTDEERKEYLDIIISESERLTDLSTNILNLSKIENQAILTDKTEINISEQIRTSISLIDNKWVSKNIDFSLQCDNDVYVIGNAQLLTQVWINLLDNAVKFSENNGYVTVVCTSDDKNAYITFSNQSKYIPEEGLQHIFDKFYQGDKSHTVKGNGLGLALVKKITELHGGEISVSTYKDEITFIIRLKINDESDS